MTKWNLDVPARAHRGVRQRRPGSGLLERLGGAGLRTARDSLVPHGQEIFGTLDTALGHYRRYSHQELKDKLERTGFRVETILNFNRISRPGWYVSGRILKRTTLGAVQMKMFDQLVWLWRRIDRHLPWPPTSIIAIAAKV